MGNPKWARVKWEKILRRAEFGPEQLMLEVSQTAYAVAFEILCAPGEHAESIVLGAGASNPSSWYVMAWASGRELPGHAILLTSAEIESLETLEGAEWAMTETEFVDMCMQDNGILPVVFQCELCESEVSA